MADENGVQLLLKPGEAEAFTRDLLWAGWLLNESPRPVSRRVADRLRVLACRFDKALHEREEWDRELIGQGPDVTCPQCGEWSRQEGACGFCGAKPAEVRR